MKICFLASGGGGNLKFLYLAQKLEIIKGIELSVIADRKCNSIDFSENNNIYSKVITYTRDNNKALNLELSIIDPDIIITNWHKIIDEEVVENFLGKMINLHYSLLPAFCELIGIASIEEAYKQGCKYVGATCHYIDKDIESGRIISQSIVKTDIKIEIAIQEVFQKSCLILLNSILLKFDDSLIDLIDNKRIDFSPSLKFDDKLFNQDFWIELSQS